MIIDAGITWYLLVSNVHFNCIVQHSLYHNMNIGTKIDIFLGFPTCDFKWRPVYWCLNMNISEPNLLPRCNVRRSKDIWSKWMDHVTKCLNRKCQDYVYVKWEYWSTMHKIKHYLKHENQINENKVLSYCETLRCETTKRTQQNFFSLHVKLTNLPSFQTGSPKSGQTYRRQVLNPRHQMPQGQSVAKLGTPL